MKTMPLTPEESDAFSRLDFWVFVLRVFAELTGEAFLDNFHIWLLCAEIDRIRTHKGTRMAIALPPRSLKSIIISVALPAWLLGHNPGMKIICASYNQEFADKLATGCRQVMQSAWYRRLFPGTRLSRQATGHLTTTRGGMRYATSVGGTLTGLGADVIIVDDPMKPEEAMSDAERARTNAWIRHTLFTRLNDKANGCIIIVMQRLHEDDPIGHIMEIADFELLSFPAIAQEDEVHLIRTPFGTLRHERKEGEALHPGREPLELLEQQRRLLGPAFFAAQYLQSPTPPGGDLIKIDCFNTYDLANRPTFTRIVQSWDTASKPTQLSDYSVCTTWGMTYRGDIYLLHVFRERLGYPDLKRKLRTHADEHRAGTVLVEDAASGIQLVQELRYEGFGRIMPIKPIGDKIMRMRAQTVAIENGRIWIPKEASWLSPYLHEMVMFPNGKYDDQVDSTAQALAHIGQPPEVDGYIGYIRQDMLRKHGLKMEDLTIIFDYFEADGSFNVPSGRLIRRWDSGFYHVSPDEWATLRSWPGITLIDDHSQS